MTAKTFKPVFALTIMFFFLSTGFSFGAGFALIEQSVSGLGNAMAGGSAVAEDASTIFFNPAGMTRIPSQTIIASHVIIPSFSFSNEGSKNFAGAALRGGEGGDAGVTKVVPNLYLVHKINDKISMGIGLYTPFGLSTKYNSDWVGRYHAIRSDLHTININPSIAYKINEHFSIGGGINASYVKATLTNAVDFGGILGVSQSSDGHVKLSGDAWGAGWNIGLLYEITKNTRVGASYRSKIRYTLEGDATFSGVPAALKPSPNFRDDKINAHLTTPDTISASIYHSLNKQWAFMGDITWTNWRTFDELRIRFDNGRADSVVTTEWKDVFRYSIGATYKPTDALTLRGGIAFDQAPISNNDKRTPRIPDGDRKWLALGAGYNLTKTLTCNIAYVHLFFSDTRINKSAVGEDRLRGSLNGTYSGYVNIFSAELRWNF